MGKLKLNINNAQCVSAPVWDEVVFSLAIHTHMPLCSRLSSPTHTSPHCAKIFSVYILSSLLCNKLGYVVWMWAYMGTM